MMKYLKKSLFCIVLLMLFSLTNVYAKEKVKVYIFEAGGCPYCELQEEYLKGLESYDKKFEIIKKELYVDHVDWQKGKDYDLGVKVANGFKKVGFEDASYKGTPFVVISDLYAKASYSTSLEEIINEAYEKGDKDIVKCYEKGNTICLDYLKENSNSNIDNSGGIIITIIICSIIMISTYIIKSNIDKKDIIEIIKKDNNIQ